MMENQSLGFAKDQNKWPQWPKLPVKRRREGQIQIGYLSGNYGTELPEPVVYLGNIWDTNWMAQEAKRYGSLEELFQDGWEVD